MGNFPSTTKNDEEALNFLALETQRLYNIPADFTGATSTPTAAQIIRGILSISGGSTHGLTLPSAASVVAAMANPQVGSSFEFLVRNTNSGTLTVTAGTGNTLTGTATMPTATNQLFRAVVTNATVGAEAVTYFPVLKTAS